MIKKIGEAHQPRSIAWWIHAAGNGSLAKHLADHRAGLPAEPRPAAPAGHQPYRDSPTANYHGAL